MFFFFNQYDKGVDSDDANAMRRWLGDFSAIDAPHKYGSRLGMAFRFVCFIYLLFVLCFYILFVCLFVSICVLEFLLALKIDIKIFKNPTFY